MTPTAVGPARAEPRRATAGESGEERAVGASGLGPRLASAFDRLRPACGDRAVARATACADALLAPVFDSRSPRRDSFSKLTSTGFPMEFAFRPGDSSLRFTAEVAGPETAPAERTRLAVARIDGLSPRDAEDLRAIQGAGRLRWGAWVGLRVTDADETLKLYAEVPEAAQGQAVQRLDRRLDGPIGIRGRPITMRMIGIAADRQAFEAYFRIIGLRPWEIRILLAAVGLEARAGTVLDLFEEAYEGALHRRLPGETFGFSYAWRTGRPPTFSLYTFASTMFGGDARTRERLLRLAGRRGWDLTTYERASEPLAHRVGAANTHGMFGVSIGPGAEPELRLGMTPVIEEVPWTT